jgi:anaerobic magnesium-protoporphyrin IX monomethyl ester cyclase
MRGNKVILFNPRSANGKHRIPNSILQVGASIYGKFDFVFIDGNLEDNPWDKIESYLKTGEYGYFGTTVMPGPQLSQAIPYSKTIREKYPDVINVWGGYFASNQYKVVIEAPFIDYIVNGPGDHAFPQLLTALQAGEPVDKVKNLIYIEAGVIKQTAKAALADQNTLPPLPYEVLDSFYPLDNYLGKTFLGHKTIAYHSSLGCPFTCSFCAVVPIFNAKWKGKSAENMYKDIMHLKKAHSADSIEFHDNNFFTSRKRVVEFAALMKDEGMLWWGEGRIDTIDKYSDDDLELMYASGCRMIFFGAETGNDEILKQMDKGGKQSAAQIKAFAGRLKKSGIIPEYSFVLGMPAETPKIVMDQIESDIEFIKEIKTINQNTEIIIYLYSPVATEGSELYEAVKSAGFAFPKILEDWLDPNWLKHDLRKNPLTPWLKPYMVDRIMNFETVLNGVYPTASDFRMKPWQKKLMRLSASVRYKTRWYRYPYEIKLMQRTWKYRQPEIEGMYME